VPGRPRTTAKAIGAGVIAVFVGARLYLGVDHPFDAAVGVALGVAVPMNAFRYFVPNETFPVSYRRGKTAHLEIDERRREAIGNALMDQVGVELLDVEHVGLAESGGSTPMRLLVKGNPDGWVFGKLYAMNHVRADRWYKFGRTLLYGRLEDEAPFESVQRLAQQEDYSLRLLRDVGIRGAAPLGVLELTPSREYLVLTEYFDGATEIGDAEVTDELIDEGLMIVRQLWDSGLAHRDIKPANLLVAGDGHLRLIDAGFVQIRPSPWRQAVDLANMMLVLAVRSDAERVYEHALALFTPDDIAEAFAAVSGIASPTQLRTMMKRDGRDLRTRFRQLAPDRRPISMQQWSARRILLALAVLATGALALNSVYGMFTPAELPVESDPTCGTEDVMILMAQAVPTATQVPCLASLPAGWDVGGVEIRRGRGWFSLDSDRAGHDAVEVTLLRPQDCSVAEATEVPSDELGMQRYEQPGSLPPELESTRSYVFTGGRVTYQFSFDGGANASLTLDADAAVGFQSRAALVREVEQDSGLRLCGAGPAICPGGSG
jgi:tRNA A-37 threonylcarbamoyl transferase component Bud32